MPKFISLFIAAGLGLGLNAAIAQNVESDKDKAQGQEQIMRDKEQGSAQAASQSSDAQRAYNEAGERQVGLEQYLKEQQECSTMSPDLRRDCMHKAQVRYEAWAVMQCELVAGATRQRCYQNIQAAVTGNRTPSAAPDGNATPETGQAGRRSEDKPER
jgi:hypothetical protein